MVPKQTGPLVKDIRTGEGIAEWALSAAATALTAVGDISVTKGLSTLTILAVVKGARRGLLKLMALQQRIGVGAPRTVGDALAEQASVQTGSTQDTASPVRFVQNPVPVPLPSTDNIVSDADEFESVPSERQAAE